MEARVTRVNKKVDDRKAGATYGTSIKPGTAKCEYNRMEARVKYVNKKGR